jgi:hypothetical protein
VQQWDRDRRPVFGSQLALGVVSRAGHPIRSGGISQREQAGDDASGSAPEASFQGWLMWGAVADEDR